MHIEESIVPIIQPYISKNVGLYQRVLVLNQDYMPLTIAHIPRALSLIGRNKAEVLQEGVAPIQTPSCSIPRPSVIRLINYIRKPRPRVRLTRREIFKRDIFQCQYCGNSPKELTIDHVLPLSRGGRDNWENLVACCQKCNKKKGARTPEEAHMPLKRKPFEPQVGSHIHLMDREILPEWTCFLPT